jgi:hypothetical protein
MTKVVHVTATLEEAEAVRSLWETIPDLHVGSFSLADFVTMQNATGALARDYRSTDAHLTAIKERRDDKILALKDVMVRFRFTVRGKFGSDSTEYSLAGGTRTRHRKPATAKSAED